MSARRPGVPFRATCVNRYPTVSGISALTIGDTIPLRQIVLYNAYELDPVPIDKRLHAHNAVTRGRDHTDGQSWRQESAVARRDDPVPGLDLGLIGQKHKQGPL